METEKNSSSLLKSYKFTLSEAADHFRVSVRTLRRWVKNGRLKAIRPAHFYLVTGAELERLLAKREDKESQPR